MVNQEFIESARALGAKSSRIVVKYIIPNVMSQFLVQSTMNVSGTILLGATLSFLGLGAQPPTPEWGAMLSEGLANYQFHPYLVTIPGVFLAITAHPYTKALLKAIPVAALGYKGKVTNALKGEISSPINPKPGCRFAPRCPYAMKRCTEENPVLHEQQPGHYVACHLCEA